jgi:hypothetical protein
MDGFKLLELIGLELDLPVISAIPCPDILRYLLKSSFLMNPNVLHIDMGLGYPQRLSLGASTFLSPNALVWDLSLKKLLSGLTLFEP